MDKRQIQDSPPKSKKRVKNGIESRPKPKTTYFFKPINRLDPPTSIRSVSPEEKNSRRDNDVPDVEQNVEQLNTKLQPQQTPTKDRKPLLEYEKLLLEQQSSDDSFDGIRWGTPRNQKVGSNNGTKQLHQRLNSSSPLKNVNSPVVNEEELKYSATLINEQVNSVLTKYGGSGFNNILSQTPKMSRTHSDGLSGESKRQRDRDFRRLESSPTMVRSKTTGLDAMGGFSLSHSKSKSSTPLEIAPLSSTLNSWIDKFDVKDLDLSSDPKYTAESVQGSGGGGGDSLVKFSENIPSQNTQNILDDIDFEDDFSDSSVIAVEDAPIEGSPKPTLASVNLINEQSDESDDPFSDDDLTGILGGSMSTSIPKLPTLHQSNSIVLDINLTTQQKNDRVHVDLFQNGMKSIESRNLAPDREPNDHPKAEVANEAKLSYKRRDLHRYQIKNIFRNTFRVQDRLRDQVILTVQDEKSVELKIVVRGEYVQLEFEVNDVIHLILTSENSPKLVDDQHNLLIWNPDVLISATTASQQMNCPRKTVLTSRFRFPGESSVPLVVGTIIHIIFQACLASDNWSDDFLQQTMNDELNDHLFEIYSIGNELEKVRMEIKEQLPYLKTWSNTYFKKPLTGSTRIPTNQRNMLSLFSVSNVLDVEENIWSPMFGLKGMVDVTVEANLKNTDMQGKFLIPMEIKTGREHISHHAQSSLYALLFKDRYDIDVNSFLLLYTKEKLLKLNTISQTDLKSLVNLRNRITKYMKEDTRELPGLLKQSACDRCEVQKSCMTINKLVENGNQSESGLQNGLYDSLTIHLDGKVNYRDFYNHWDELLTKEESVVSLLKKDLWTLTAKEREEKGGKALSNLFIKESGGDDDLQTKFTYTFERASNVDANTLQLSQLCKNDRVIISDEKGHFAIAQGFILSIRPSFIVISSNRRIINSSVKTNSFNMNNNQTFHSVLHKTLGNSTFPLEQKTYRIDKDEMFHGMGLARYNILNLFLEGGDEMRRASIVDKKEPKFSSGTIKPDIIKDFNSDQVNAFNKVLNTKDYCLILGMPGTGKTTVIARIIQFLVQSGKSVLLAAYTHSAVDNILLKVKDSGINILRVGHPARVHPDIRKFVAGCANDSAKISNYSEFIRTYMNPQVVATTCLGVGDIAFNLRSNFDYCIIDEASQVSMPVSLGPLRFCTKFVLVGDHHQLPPLVQHPSPVVKNGLSQSLFKILSEEHPQSIVELSYQYRMCEEIMLLSNLLVYSGRLKCGSSKVAKQSLAIPHPERINSQISTEYDSILLKNDLWLNDVLEPQNKVLFLNHDSVPGEERVVGEKVENPKEVDLIHQIISALTLCGVQESSIGVMSLYRAQLRLLTRRLVQKPKVEILTADQFQGRDKECIIISLVRSNKESRVGDLLKEWRRVNVAITRSKCKLILVGSKSTLKTIPTLAAFMGLIESRGWMHDLPKNADRFYSFPFDVDSPVKKTKLSTTKVGDKLVGNHPVLKDIFNELTN